MHLPYLLSVLLDDVGCPGAALPSARGRARVQPEEEALPVAVHAALRLLGVRVLRERAGQGRGCAPDENVAQVVEEGARGGSSEQSDTTITRRNFEQSFALASVSFS